MYGRLVLNVPAGRDVGLFRPAAPDGQSIGGAGLCKPQRWRRSDERVPRRGALWDMLRLENKVKEIYSCICKSATYKFNDSSEFHANMYICILYI